MAYRQSALLALFCACGGAVLAQTPDDQWYGAFAGSDILGRNCTITGGTMDMRTRFGVPSFIEGGASVPAIASEAMVLVYRDMIEAAKAADMNAILNLTVSVEVAQDFVMQSGVPQTRGDKRVYADGLFLIIAQGDMVSADCAAN